MQILSTTRRQHKFFLAYASLLVLLFACSVFSQENAEAPATPDAASQGADEEKKIAPLKDEEVLPILSVHKTKSGLKYEVHIEGKGAVAAKDKPVTVHYTGWLDNNGKRGRRFDSSKDRGTAFLFYLGRAQVIPGWEEGIQGMKIGERRTLYIPAKLAYGADGAGATIPPNADLIFDVELVDVY